MKKIMLNDEAIASIRKQFESALELAKQDKFLSDKFTFTASCVPSPKEERKSRVKITFRPSAYLKMLALLHEFNTEVAWHGVVERLSDFEFLVSNILVYPQTVSGATVNTDQEAYQQWMMNLDDETYNHLHFQGHSHVNMDTAPSSTDLEHQKKIVSQLEDEDFYIFMIWNKKLSFNAWVYDMKTNTTYETTDVDVSVEDDSNNLSAFLAEAKSLVQKPKPPKKAEKKKETKEQQQSFDPKISALNWQDYVYPWNF